MTERDVHPAAAVFPMLADDELAELAESIRANGLRHPIALDTDGRIVDGRNRDAACLMAGVEPTFITLPTETDILAYILDENDRRRHMSKGQRAMAIAMMIETEEGKRTRGRALTLEAKVSEARVSQAVAIRRHASDLAPGVLAGTESFDKAYETARARKQEQERAGGDRARRAHEEAVELERIRRVAPDIAELVPGTLTVDEAKVALHQRRQRERERKEATTSLAESAFAFLDSGVAATPEERAAQIIETLDATMLPTRPDLGPSRASRCLATLEALAALLREKEDDHGRSTVAG